MASDFAKLEENLVTAISALAERAGNEQVAGYSAAYAAAALSLSESLAWYRSPGQPHGGSVSVSS